MTNQAKLTVSQTVRPSNRQTLQSDRNSVSHSVGYSRSQSASQLSGRMVSGTLLSGGALRDEPSKVDSQSDRHFSQIESQ